jgi:microsomal dipeptidase-like Zn-dependent dipeptidase
VTIDRIEHFAKPVGWSDEQITGILGGNAMRVFEQVCG